MAVPLTPPPTACRYRMLALDIDGTLLDSTGTLRPTTAAAVARAAAAGIRPVLCTGRRYRRARPVAEMLGLDAPLVCNSGALVKDPAGGRTLWRADLEPVVVRELLDLFRRHAEPAISFLDHTDGDAHDFLVAAYPTGRPLPDEFVRINREHACVDPGWTDRYLNAAWSTAQRPFHLCAIGTLPEMLDFEEAVRAEQAGRARTFVQKSPRYTGTMCEIIAPEASKWSAVLHLAELWGVAAPEICAVGDDMNDVPMIQGAGLGVAMGHAPPAVLEVADHVTDDHDTDGVARLVDEVLLG